jgi:hypothetical protein
MPTMPIRAYLVLYRTRLIWSAIVALLIPFAIVLLTASEGSPDLGVFWNHFCGCAPGTGDTVVLLYGSLLTALIVGILLGPGDPSVKAHAAGQGVPGSRSDMPFLLTRPITRSSTLLLPVIIATSAIAILPTLGFTIIFSWLRLVHAPALAFFAQALRLIPSVVILPANASLPTVLIAAHMPANYLASLSTGLLAFSLFYAKRWLMLSRSSWVGIAGALLPSFLYFTPLATRWLGRGYTSVLYLVPPKQNLAWYPTPYLLFFHYAIPVALLFWSWRTLQTADF